MKKGWISKKAKIEIDALGNKNYLLTGPFLPKNNPWGLSAWINNFANWVTFYIEKEGVPDIIHAHTYLGAAVAIKIKGRYGVPVLVSEHYTGWMDGSIRASHQKLALKGLNQASLVTTVSYALKKSLQPFLKKEIQVLPNFIDTKIFNYNFHSNGHFISDKLKIICVGDLIPRKRVDLSLKAIKHLSKNQAVQFTIVGDGETRPSLQKLVTELNLEEIVTFTGKLEKPAIAQLLKQHDIFLHASKLETFGLVIAEALCCGLSVISTSNQGVDMMNGLSGLQIVQNDSAESLSLELERVFNQIDITFKKDISDVATKVLGVKAYKKVYSKLIPI